MIYTSDYSLQHELVHAVVGNPDLDRFFGEGIANAFDHQAAVFGFSEPSANIGLEMPDARVAAHFVRWLREMWGPLKLGELSRSEGAVWSDFERIYGIALLEAEEIYFAEAPAVYPPLFDCSAPEFDSTSFSLAWTAKWELACALPGTQSAPIGLRGNRILVVPEDGYYSLMTDADLVGIRRCEDEPSEEYWDGQWDGGKAEESDVPSAYSAFPVVSYRFFDGQDIRTVYLRRGRHDVIVAVEGKSGRTVNTVVWPSLGPMLVEGE